MSFFHCKINCSSNPASLHSFSITESGQVTLNRALQRTQIQKIFTIYSFVVVVLTILSPVPVACASVILATLEAEIRAIAVQSQPEQIVPRDPILKKSFTKKGWWSGSRCKP
jgi:hypothetical protein